MSLSSIKLKGYELLLLKHPMKSRAIAEKKSIVDLFECEDEFLAGVSMYTTANLCVGGGRPNYFLFTHATVDI